MAEHMTNERRAAYVEVIEILKHMDEKYVNKIPRKLREFFETNSSKDYEFKLNVNKALTEQNLKRNTVAILGMLDLNYWCESEEEKQELRKLFDENEAKYQNELREKYNPDNIFKKPDSVQEEKEEVALVEYKEPIVKRIINKIKEILHIKS